MIPRIKMGLFEIETGNRNRTESSTEVILLEISFEIQIHDLVSRTLLLTSLQFMVSN